MVFCCAIFVLAGFGASPCCALDILDASDVFEDIFKTFAFVFDSRRAVLALEQFQEFLEVVSAGLHFRDRPRVLAFGKQIAGLGHTLLGSELFAHLCGLQQQRRAGRVRGSFELTHSQEYLFESGILGG